MFYERRITQEDRDRMIAHLEAEPQMDQLGYLARMRDNPETYCTYGDVMGSLMIFAGLSPAEGFENHFYVNLDS